ncbi:hypothetical protein G7Y89_g9984 [Cudoniella acicularis]|uniref:Uncharacterized protein n=1 Tax=Cudoniella acicularis TaxID=354080 RepID=A0A8H4RDM4_9HELO|nr:hypothetical protein G7Y89_g9984 [Cudoniella acicularis]
MKELKVWTGVTGRVTPTVEKHCGDLFVPGYTVTPQMFRTTAENSKQMTVERQHVPSFVLWGQYKMVLGLKPGDTVEAVIIRVRENLREEVEEDERREKEEMGLKAAEQKEAGWVYRFFLLEKSL